MSRIPRFVRGGSVTLFTAGTVIGLAALLNHGYNCNQTRVLSPGVIEFRKMDGAYAHTIVTKGDPHYGKDSVKIERNSWNKSRTYVGYSGCSSVDEIILQEGILGTGISLEYTRNKDSKLKQHMFDLADGEMQEQCRRFRSMNSVYFPNRLSR